MNKIFKNIWNHFRGQVVCVSEKSSSHDHSSASESVDSTNETFIIAKTFVRTAISTAVLTAFMVGQPVQAAIDYTQWGQEEDVKTGTVNVPLRETIGSNYGHITDWMGWGSTEKNVITFTENAQFVGGVFWESTDNHGQSSIEGEIGKSGLARHWALINKGRYVDSKDSVLGHKQLGTTNWFHKFANLANGEFDVYDLRSSEVLNQSTKFSVDALHLQAGGQLENSGTMNIGELRVGIKVSSLSLRTQNL